MQRIKQIFRVPLNYMYVRDENQTTSNKQIEKMWLQICP